MNMSGLCARISVAILCLSGFQTGYTQFTLLCVLKTSQTVLTISSSCSICGNVSGESGGGLEATTMMHKPPGTVKCLGVHTPGGRHITLIQELRARNGFRLRDRGLD